MREQDNNTVEIKAKSKSIETRLRKAGASALVILGAVGLAGCGQETNIPAPNATSSETGEPTPEATWSPEYTATELQIPTGLSTEELGEAYTTLVDKWTNAGTDNKTIVSKWMDLSKDDFIDWYRSTVKAKYAEIFSDAIYIDDWESHKDLKKDYDVTVGLNEFTVFANIVTSNPLYDASSFHRHITYLDSKELSNDGNTRVISVDFVEYNNEIENRVGEKFYPEAKNLGQAKGTMTLTFVVVDGVEKLAKIAYAVKQ